ncbi:signal recognition particle-docking protein FtsY [Shewanella sp. Choline-02u-19]|uniref:signal recognition particle-docking protein FtsY n=1 Tax=unclassified Shewanella TaxID=196818 RepID=UPI000C33502C|nr:MULTISPECIES: signal recognition particle-docking protein FtsY [unclassified Shewanella]PKH57198.1 signal recognition particle-docking protein FtsY [Shewanella sp. Bg11-22]PKI29687.1 signal recognition particle-docking protein FtsY [Shewanella sp. Choline-02u-19]
MAKKGFFSWFRKDKSTEQPQEAEAELNVSASAETEQADAKQIEADNVAAELVESERVAAEQAAETEAARIAAEQAEAETVAAEQAAETEAARIAAEQAEAETVAAEQAAEAEAARIAAEQAEVERVAAEQAAEAEAARIAAEQAEAETVAAEQAAEAEAARIAAEQAEVERVAAEQAAEAEAARIAAEQAEVEIVAAEQAAEAARIAAEQAEVETVAAEQAAQADNIATEQQPEPQAKPVKEGLFARLKRGLKRTSASIGSGFVGLFSGKKIDDDLFEELEEQLLIADVGVETTTRLIKNLTEQASRKQLKDGEALYELMRDEMQKILDPVSIPLIPENADGPFVILMVGVNGVGKTTTIGKLAKQYQAEGKTVMLAAGDTFRAAAVEQLQVWGQRNDIPVIAQHTGADSASVLFDALQAAKARKVDVLIADTAGRLQNKAHLMDELKKVVRVMKKQNPAAPHEVMLTLDASTGQNAINQAKIFQEAVGVTGITISKLDGTAKGGVIFAIADKFGIPIRHIGVGEQIDDLRTFDAKDFIEALFSQSKDDIDTK